MTSNEGGYVITNIKNKNFQFPSRSNNVRQFLLILSIAWMASTRRGATIIAFNPVRIPLTSTNTNSRTACNTINNQRNVVDDDGESTNSIIQVQWLIIGGGIHGVHIAASLIGNGGIKDIQIVDANESLLQKWKSRTAATGMEYLRSSAGYHLDLDEHSLRRQFGVDTGNAAVGNTKGVGRKKFKKSRKKNVSLQGITSNDVFAKDYERPRLDAFNEHCDSVITKYNLDQLHVQGIVTSIEPKEDHVKVVLSLLSEQKKNINNNEYDIGGMISYTYTAQNVILALGNDEPSYADWVDEEDIEQGFVRHILDDTQRRAGGKVRDHDVKDIAVLGGGITAAHKVLELVRANSNKNKSKNDSTRTTIHNDTLKRRIHLISRNTFKEQQFDTHQDWMMDQAASKRSEEGGGYGTPDRQKKFKSSTCWKERRKTIVKERVAGTVTPAIFRGEGGLCYAINNGDIKWHHAEVVKKRYIEIDMDESENVDDDYDNIDAVTKRASKSGTQKRRIELSLSSGNTIEVDEILLATGFGKKLPGGKLIKDLVENFDLEVSDFCGFPIVDENLSWGSRGIYVAGALAELEIGPSARNIAGARLAAERILKAATKEKV
jgi:lysine/ornithine N-monooxygenase